MDSDDLKRLEALERRIAALESRIGAPATSPAQLLPAESREPKAESKAPTAERRDWEALIGRYGTLVLATITVLAAVGTFIGWAVSRGWLGPTQRVGLGLAAAALLAGGGFWLRQRERSFGSSLLGLSLAVVQACAWGAGPSLHLVPDQLAFSLASVASIALAAFARVEEDEPLWSVGFVGAAIAPFVTSSEPGSMGLLASYGGTVLVAGGFAIGVREWRVAGRIWSAVATLYVGALMLGTERHLGPIYAFILPVTVGFVGVLPWSSASARRGRVRALGALAALASLRVAFTVSGFPVEVKTMALMSAAAFAWIVLLDVGAVAMAQPDAPSSGDGDWVDGLAVPMVFVIALFQDFDAGRRGDTILLATCGAVLLASAVRHRTGVLRDAVAVATVLCSIGAAAQWFEVRPMTATVAVASIGFGTFAVHLWRPSRAWTTLGMIVLAWAILTSLVSLAARPAYEYTPFGTRESGAAAFVLAATLGAWRIATDAEPRKVLLIGSAVWAFAWIHQELWFAFNRTAATLLRVSYYAATSVAGVWIGRARRVAVLRHVGLALAIVAAGTALSTARALSNVGARIGADLVAAAFLLAIAYWYRKPGTSSTTASTSAAVTESQSRP